MKKLFLVGALALFAAVNAQSGLKVGVHAGLPMGESADVVELNLGVDVAYNWKISEKFLVGATTGYSHFVGKDLKIDDKKINLDAGVIPVAATVQYNVKNNFFVGLDLGYALITSDWYNDGGVYYQPKVGYTFKDKHGVYVAYKGISDGELDATSVNIGYTYSFGKK